MSGTSPRERAVQALGPCRACGGHDLGDDDCGPCGSTGMQCVADLLGDERRLAAAAMALELAGSEDVTRAQIAAEQVFVQSLDWFAADVYAAVSDRIEGRVCRCRACAGSGSTWADYGTASLFAHGPHGEDVACDCCGGIGRVLGEPGEAAYDADDYEPDFDDGDDGEPAVWL